MEKNSLDYIQFQYGYRDKYSIETSKDNFFEFITNKNSNIESITYIKYNNVIFEANFNKDERIIFFQRKIYDEKEINSINKNFNFEKYEVREINKFYTGFNFSNLDYVKNHTLTIQSNKLGYYINPEIKIENNKASILKNNEIIGKVNDLRSINLLNSLNKKRDILVIKDNTLYIYTFKDILEHEGNLKIKIFNEEKNKIGKVIKLIKQGCKFDKEIWLFLSDDISTLTPNSMILLLPDKKYCKCLLDGDELIIKKVINTPRKIKGKSTLFKVNISNLEFEEFNIDIKANENNLKNDGFNDLEVRKLQNVDLIKMIKSYEDTEIEILNDIKRNCGDLRYTSMEKDKLIINQRNLENLESWSGKYGATICYKSNNKNVLLGNLKDIGENYVQIEFKDDLTRNSIPRKDGLIGISLIGDEIIHKRRSKAIDILENNSAPIENLTEILNGNCNLEVPIRKNFLKKSEIGNLSKMQIDAIEGALNTPDIFLIQGPPGAGKTTVIRKIVEKILNKKGEVLITSYQNLAVDNVLDGFLNQNIIPYRFGNDDNLAMQKICTSISKEINLSLKQNISKDLEEKIQTYKEEIIQCRGNLLNAYDKVLLDFEINNAMELIKDFEGMSSSYIEFEHILEKINKSNQNECRFDINVVKETMPAKFAYDDLDAITKIRDTEEYLKNVNKKLNSTAIHNVIKELENLQDIEIIFTLDDREYQKKKSWIFDELKLIKSNDDEEIDILGICVNSVAILDKILANLPEYVEDRKYKFIKEFHEKINNNPILLESILKKYSDIRGTTCQKAGSKKFNESTNGMNYNYVIVDEAGRANPLDLLIPLIKGYRIILVGDHKQLPHMIENYIEDKMKENGDFDKELYDKYIKESLFGRLFEQLPSNRKVMLDTQYRMNVEIGNLVSRLFYNNKLNTGTKIINDTNFYNNKSLVVVDVKGNQKKTNSGSWINNKEVDEIIEKLKELDELQKESENKITVGIISFYKAQVENIKFKINSMVFNNIEVDVGTVDAYQGLEKDFIFISSVRTNGIGFIANPNRLNVSLSRAKKLAIIFGDISNLNKNSLFKKIISSCSDGGER